DRGAAALDPRGRRALDFRARAADLADELFAPPVRLRPDDGARHAAPKPGVPRHGARALAVPVRAMGGARRRAALPRAGSPRRERRGRQAHADDTDERSGAAAPAAEDAAAAAGVR